MTHAFRIALCTAALALTLPVVAGAQKNKIPPVRDPVNHQDRRLIPRSRCRITIGCTRPSSIRIPCRSPTRSTMRCSE